MLNRAVCYGENPEIVSNHLFMLQSEAKNNLQLVINRGLGLNIYIGQIIKILILRIAFIRRLNAIKITELNISYSVMR